MCVRVQRVSLYARYILLRLEKIFQSIACEQSMYVHKQGQLLSHQPLVEILFIFAIQAASSRIAYIMTSSISFKYKILIAFK